MKRIITYCNLFTIALLFIPPSGGGGACQNSSDKVALHHGKKYYIHIVTKGETLYGISKDYNIEVRDIVLENPRAIDGISSGDTLQLPFISKSGATKAGQNIQIGDSSLFRYIKVEPKSTAYSLCKQYGISASELDSINPSLQEKGLKAGMILRLPKNKIPAKSHSGNEPSGNSGVKGSNAKEAKAYKNLVQQEGENDMTNANSQAATKRDTSSEPPVVGQILDRYNVALMLPFMNEDVDSLNMNKLLNGAQQFPPLAQISSDFYEGATLALDSMAKMGIKVNLHVFNIPSDSSAHKIDSLLKSSVFRTMNLIIGPLSPSHFRQVAAFALKNKIPIVSPLSPSSEVIRNNPYTSMAAPAPSTEMEQLADYIVSHFQSASIIIVRNPDAANDNYFETVKKRISTALSINEPRTDSLYIANYSDDLNGLGKRIDEKKFNIIITPYQDASFVTKFLNQLSNSKYAQDDSLAVFGMHNWSSIDVIDVNNLDTLHFHYPTNEYIDYSNPAVARFIQKFKNQYFTEPSSYSLQGFDIMYYYLSLLKKFGTAMQDNLEVNPYTGIHTSFDFYKPNPAGGLENKAIFILEYKNYNLVKDK